MDNAQVRRRQRMACESCRERKRKCDGTQPCSMCRGYGYSCEFRTKPRRRRTTAARTSQAVTADIVRVEPIEREGAVARPPASSTQTERPDEETYIRSLTSNSGLVFARTLRASLDPANEYRSPQRMLAWNLFLGSRQLPLPTSPRTLDLILGRDYLRQLVDVYFKRPHLCYGFVDEAMIYRLLDARVDNAIAKHDAVLSGIAVLGSLFSDPDDLVTESNLAHLATDLLDRVSCEPPSLHIATAWVLRIVYLRLTGKPEPAWLASCTALHMIDAAGLHTAPNTTTGRATEDERTPEIRRRLYGVATHLNMWISYDLSRSRVVLQNVDTTPPTPWPGEYTTEVLELLTYTAHLNPSEAQSMESLQSTLGEVLNRVHTAPPSVLAQTNLVLALIRRLHISKWDVSELHMNKALELFSRGIRAVLDAIGGGSPWHQVANVPFQVVCVLLAIDTPESFELLDQVMSCLTTVHNTYRTSATNEALSGAFALLQMSQRRKEADIQRQSTMVKMYPTASDRTSDLYLLDDQSLDSWWQEFMHTTI